jgi:hypothetical protein
MQTVLDLAQPYILTILQAVLAMLAAIVLALLYKLRSKIEQWLDTRTSANERELLHRLAAEAYAFVEQEWKELDGESKLEAAAEYVLERWKLRAVGLDYNSVKAAVRKAWTELDAKNRRNAS